MNSARNAIDGYCQCTDDDLDRLRALIAADVPQWQASLHLWGPRRTVSDRLRARLHEAGRADWSLPVALACLLGVVVVVLGGLR